ncbi:hypothetical protein [Maliponia aquimaris]|uniref:Uncharacterized protein n=1 Tax=Maliponia aquimaris TaxID=1673631 RepID=A0A238JN17_9RHOB|nr:hypothetical protein [Maliponia aquimaris]SMX32041.1 hypothetical protein MAA8898_00123 [Maliponia aquimaris]
MAVFAFLFGSIVGLFCAIFGWVAYDMSFLAGAGLYFTLNFTVGFFLVLANMPLETDTERVKA